MKKIQVTLQRGDVAKDAWISGCVRIERPGDGQPQSHGTIGRIGAQRGTQPRDKGNEYSQFSRNSAVRRGRAQLLLTILQYLH